MVRMMALLQQAGQGMIAGKVATDQMPTIAKSSFAESFIQLAGKSEVVRSADDPGTAFGEKASAKSQTEFVPPSKQTDDGENKSLNQAGTMNIPIEGESVDGDVGGNPGAPASGQVRFGSSPVKLLALNVKVERAGTDPAELGSTAEASVIASTKPRLVLPGNTPGRNEQVKSVAANAGEAGMSPAISDKPIGISPMVGQDAAPNEAGNRGMKAEAAPGKKTQPGETERTGKGKSAESAGPAVAVVAEPASPTGAVVDMTVPMTQQTVVVQQPLRRDEVVAVAVGQSKKRDVGVGIDPPERRRDARTEVEQAGLEQAGVAVAGESGVGGRKESSGESQIIGVDETGKMTLGSAGVGGMKMQEFVVGDALTGGINGHGTERGAGMQPADNGGLRQVSSSQDGLSGDSQGNLMDGHRTLTATATTLEVGIPNGAHGWLKIRAEIGSGGEVTAALSSASSSGQEMLRRELPSLSSFLQEEHLMVHPVIVTKTTVEGGGSGFTREGSGEAAGGGQAEYGRSRQDSWKGEEAQDETPIWSSAETDSGL